MIVPWPGADLAKDPIEKLIEGYAKIGIDRETALKYINAAREQTPELPTR